MLTFAFSMMQWDEPTTLPGDFSFFNAVSKFFPSFLSECYSVYWMAPIHARTHARTNFLHDTIDDSNKNRHDRECLP